MKKAVMLPWPDTNPERINMMYNFDTNTDRDNQNKIENPSY